MINSVRLIGAALTLLASYPTTSIAAERDGNEPATLILSIDTQIKEGTVFVSLFHGQENYDNSSNGFYAKWDVGSSSTISFENLEPGSYAIRAYHDLNGNEEMDFNLFGIPQEPFAFSNNAPAKFGPASWEDAAFEISAPTTTHSMDIK